MALSNFTKFATITGVGVTLTFAGVTWGGQGNLNNVKTEFDKAIAAITTLQNNATNYIKAIANRDKIIEGYKTKAESLQAKIDELQAKLDKAEQDGTADSETITELQNQIATLQEEKAQLESQIAQLQTNSNALMDEVNRLEGELDKANTASSELDSYVQSKANTYKDVTAVTEEELNSSINIAGLYYTWETNNDNTAVNDYFNKLNVVDERNESPVLMQASAGNILNIGNMRAFKKVYNMESGQDFNTVYASKLAQYNDRTDMTESDKFYNAVSQMSFTVTIEGTNYTIQADTNVALTPGGEVVAKDTWFVRTANNINF